MDKEYKYFCSECGQGHIDHQYSCAWCEKVGSLKGYRDRERLKGKPEEKLSEKVEQKVEFPLWRNCQVMTRLEIVDHWLVEVEHRLNQGENRIEKFTEKLTEKLDEKLVFGFVIDTVPYIYARLKGIDLNRVVFGSRKDLDLGVWQVKLMICPETPDLEETHESLMIVLDSLYSLVASYREVDRDI